LASDKESFVRAVISLLIGVGVFVGQAQGQERAPGKVVLDLWDAAYLPGGKAGYVHTTVRQVERDGRKLFRTTEELHLTVKRFQTAVQLRMESGTEETPEGKVVGTFMRQYQGRSQQLTIRGTVAGKQLQLVKDGTEQLKPAPWDGRVLGKYRQLKLFLERKVKPGDTFSYRSFEPTINLVIRIDARVKDFEDVELPGKGRRRLLRVETKAEKIEKVQLPTMVTWLDDDRMPVRSQVELPGLGLLTLYRTTRQGATAPAQVAALTDIGIGNFVRLRQPIPNAYRTRSMVYHIRLEGDEDPATAFSRDDRQQVKNLSKEGKTFDLYVRASRPPQPGQEEKEGAGPGEEFRQSSYFITSDDPKVRAHAREAVGDEADPWRKALRIERWVHGHMHSVNDEALATASHVARTLEGDCTEYAMLMAAMCRAVGVPSRTAVGLIYAEPDRRPVFAFHMWTEVWVRGRWVPLDATLGQGYVGATHLKITDASWHDTRSMTPLLPVLRVLGKVSIEVAGASR
jgi:transglutaminase-like putative cysteine protease